MITRNRAREIVCAKPLVNMDSRAQQLIKFAGGLESHRDEWKGIWDMLRRRIVPRKSIEDNQPNIPDFERHHSSSAWRAANMLAASHMMYIVTINQPWFRYKSPNGDEKSEKWYGNCTEQTLKTLSASNFYTEIHQCVLDRVIFGTGAMCAFGDDKRGVSFKHIPCGTYAIAEGANGCVDVLVRRFQYSARQAADDFGLDNLGEKLKAAYEDEAKQNNVEHEFIHVVRPNKKFKLGSVNPKEKRYESVYVSVSDKVVVEDRGYSDFPFFVTRFERYGKSAYGLPPGLAAMPDIYRALYIEGLLDTAGEIAVYPRVLELANQIGEIDFRAGGRTIITPEAASLNVPKEWMTNARYDIGQDRLKYYDEKIHQAFYADMIQVISNIDREMTATEVNAREAEKLLVFAPSYSQMVSDLETLHRRLFGMQLEAGSMWFAADSIPNEAKNEGGQVVPPRQSYQGKIALAMERLQTEGLSYAMNDIAGLSQIFPGILDGIDSDKILPIVWRNRFAPEGVLKDPDEVARIRQEKVEQEQAMLEVQMAQAGAGVAKDAASAGKTAREGGLI